MAKGKQAYSWQAAVDKSDTNNETYKSTLLTCSSTKWTIFD